MKETKEIAGPCRLCKVDKVLRQSHVVPKFVFRWLKKSSPGHLRTVETPNRRSQDGPTRAWLCDDCEQRLSGWENEFAAKVFEPLHQDPLRRAGVRYESWALNFAVSISWRTLHFYANNSMDHLDAKDLKSIDVAERVWRRFLLGQIGNLGEFTQHIIVVDAPTSVSSDEVSPFISRYMARTVHSDIVRSTSACFTYTKLCRLVVIGFLRVDHAREWDGTRITSRGKIGGAVRYRVPEILFGYWNDKANQAAQALSSMSPKQRDKINELIQNADPGLLTETDLFRAIQADVELSGGRAFEVTAPSGITAPSKDR
ncbi:hypothetical protein [Sorangium sp. So ce861]|uniref:hypothetical protein n=1 Tax=Sorangium sp. So ce861 TaxID=3133323 RepID=UPI003F6425B8